jgi:hypothetical protein
LINLGYQAQLSGQESDGGQGQGQLYPKFTPRSNESSPRKPQDKSIQKTVNTSALLSPRPQHQRSLDISLQNKVTDDQKDSSSDEDKRKSLDLNSGHPGGHPGLTAEISRLSVENERLVFYILCNYKSVTIRQGLY